MHWLYEQSWKYRYNRYGRANEILEELEKNDRKDDILSKNNSEHNESEGMQLSFVQLDDPVLSQVRDEIKNLDVNNLTPLEALNKLNDIKRIINGK